MVDDSSSDVILHQRIGIATFNSCSSGISTSSFSAAFCSDSSVRLASTDFKKMGQRIFVFIIGGATRSEVNFLKKLFLVSRTPVMFWISPDGFFFFFSSLSLSLWYYCQLRVCHKLTTKLRREVILGSSSIDDPPQYITVINA